MVRVKTWGKSLRLHAVMHVAGKPCMLKCHVYYVEVAKAQVMAADVSGPFIEQQCLRNG